MLGTHVERIREKENCTDVVVVGVSLLGLAVMLALFFWWRTFPDKLANPNDFTSLERRTD
jgi:hypothetical protein